MGNEIKGEKMRQIMEKSGGVGAPNVVGRKRESLVLNMSAAVVVVSKS